MFNDVNQVTCDRCDVNQVTSDRGDVNQNVLLCVAVDEAPLDMSPDSGINELAGLTLEEQEHQKQEWQAELIKVSVIIQLHANVPINKYKR